MLCEGCGQRVIERNKKTTDSPTEPVAFLLSEFFLLSARCFTLFAAFDAGTLVMLSFTQLGVDAGFGAVAFETLERTVQGLIVLEPDL